MLIEFQGAVPNVAPTAFVADSATVIGDVTIGTESSLWYNVVARGDINFIRIGNKTNIQDGTVIHVGRNVHPVIVGNEVTIGHNVTLHGCRVGDRCLIGIGAVLLDGAEIAENSIVAAGSLLSPGSVIPARSLAMGSPARVVRTLTDTELDGLRRSAEDYVVLSRNYRA